MNVVYSIYILNEWIQYNKTNVILWYVLAQFKPFTQLIRNENKESSSNIYVNDFNAIIQK